MAERSRPLDGLRGIAILLVLFQHTVTVRKTPPSLTFRYILEQISGFGHTGVDLFFVLSGFLLAGILIDHGRSRGALIVFYVRRACRILPLYLTFLAVALTLSWANDRFQWNAGIHNQLPAWSYFTFTQNIMMALRGKWTNVVFSPLWSLGVEEQFYLMLPILILSIPKRGVCAVAGVMLAVDAAFRIYSRGILASYVCLPWRGDGLMIGVILAVVVRDERMMELVKRNRGRLSALAVVMALSWFRLAFNNNEFGAFTLTWVAMFFGVLVLLTATSTANDKIARFFGSRLLVWVGTVSYGVYILHRLILVLVFKIVFNRFPSIDNLPNALLTIAGLMVTFFIAEMSYTYFERPIIEYGHRLRYPSTEREEPVGGAPIVTAS